MRTIRILFVVAVFALAACAPAAQQAAPTAPPAAPSATTVPAAVNPPVSTPTPEALSQAAAPTAIVEAAPQASAPAWQTLPLVNARTGETFTLADFSGKTVLARAFATWCTNCRRGQAMWRDTLQAQVNADEVIFVSLSVETNLESAAVAAYAEDNGFDWVFAVLTADALRALNDAFGSGVNTPPSEPQFVIMPDGSFSPLYFGGNADETLTRLSGGAA